MELIHSNFFSQILNSYFNVYNTLGYDFLEKVCENELFLEFELQGLLSRSKLLLKFSLTKNTLAIILHI